MELCREPANPALKQVVAEWVSKGMDLFFNAVYEGDLETIKMLHNQHKIEYGARSKAEGMTALQLACEKGYTQLVQWLIDVAEVDLYEPDKSAIHYAVERCCKYSYTSS